MRIRTGLLGIALVAGGVVAGVSAPAYAFPNCANAYTRPILVGSPPNTFVEVDGEVVCINPDDPNDGKPLPVTLQRLSGATWITVSTGLGTAIHTCTGTSARQYRALQRSTVVATLNCT
jgi:hypothetical protein